MLETGKEVASLHTFDYTFLKYGRLSPDFVDIIGDIKERNAVEGIRRKKFAETFEVLEKKAIFTSIVASNAIEGINTTEERAAQIVKFHAKPQTHDEQEIAGYRDALKIVHENHGDLDVSETTILRLHSEIYKFTDKEKGVYKSRANAIYSFDQWGNREVVFTPVAPKETGRAMGNLIYAYQEATIEQVNDLLLIPCVILDFLCIHPFTDGNGRVSRILTLLMLYKCGFDVGKYISFENQINKWRANYYQSLSECSSVWHNEPLYEPFMRFYLKVLYACYEELANRFVGVAEEKESKKERVKRLVMANLAPLSKKEIAERLPDISTITITNVLIELEKKGAIIKTGTGRATKYIRSS